MPRTCTCCTHSSRAEIDSALLENQTLRYIAGQFKVSKSALERHREHITTSLTKASQAREVADADNLLEQVKTLQSRALSILDKAESGNDLKTALGGIREARACLELLAKLTGEIDARPQVNITFTREWADLRLTITSALTAFPEAREAVSSALATVQA